MYNRIVVRPHPLVSVCFWKRRLFLYFQKKSASTRCVFESFCARLHDGNSITSLPCVGAWVLLVTSLAWSMRNACSMWCMTSSYSKISAFVRPNVNVHVHVSTCIYMYSSKQVSHAHCALACEHTTLIWGITQAYQRQSRKGGKRLSSEPFSSPAASPLR